MKLILVPELELLLTHSTIEQCLVTEEKDGAWAFTLRIRNPKDNSLNDYRLVSQRGKRREWSDPRTMFRFIKEQYRIKQGQFQLR